MFAHFRLCNEYGALGPWVNVEETIEKIISGVGRAVAYGTLIVGVFLPWCFVLQLDARVFPFAWIGSVWFEGALDRLDEQGHMFCDLEQFVEPQREHQGVDGKTWFLEHQGALSFGLSLPHCSAELIKAKVVDVAIDFAITRGWICAENCYHCCWDHTIKA